MNLIFFQNCISPHQIPYIRECVKDKRIDSVTLIVPRVDYEQRMEMGWDNKQLVENTGIKCLLKPSDKEVNTILKEKNDCICLFSGIRGDSDVFHWLNLSLAYDVKRYVITEPPFTFNKPLWMHYLRFYFQDYRYVKHINGVFAIGPAAVSYYRSISKKWKVFPFQYVTEKVERTAAVPQGKMKLLFVGSLSKRKNVSVVIKALQGINDVDFNIVGNGEERNMLDHLASQLGVKCYFMGTKSMSDIPSIMQQNDVLVLPSLHDGWGAVVNEAMGLGLYVIVSDKCGAKTLLDNEDKGLVFKNNDVTDLKENIKKCASEISSIRHNTDKRLALAEKIQGKSVAKYFIDCLINEP